MQTRPVSPAPAPSQGAGTPHISVSSEYVRELISQAGRRSQPEHLQYEQIPATQGRLDPGSIDAQVPQVQITQINLHPSVEAAQAPGNVASFSVPEGIDPYEAGAALAEAFDPELAALFRTAQAEQSVIA